MSDQARPSKSDRPRSGRRPPLTGVVVTLAGIGVLALLVLAIDPLRDSVEDVLSGRTGALRYDLRSLGVGGVLIVFLLALVHVVVWYPTEILNLASGFVYGFWGALALMTVAWTVNGIVGYFVGLYAARPLLFRVIGQDRFERIERIAANAGCADVACDAPDPDRALQLLLGRRRRGARALFDLSCGPRPSATSR